MNMLFILSLAFAFCAGVVGAVFNLMGREKSPLTVFFFNLLVCSILNGLIIGLGHPDFSFAPIGGWAILFFVDFLVLSGINLLAEARTGIASAIVGVALFVVWTMVVIWGYAGGPLDNRGLDRLAFTIPITDAVPNQEGKIVFPETDIEDLMLLSPENAISVANQSMGGTGNIGSYLYPNAAPLQHVNNRLVYPVDFGVRDFYSFQAAGDRIPGYILVPAAEQNSVGQFVSGYSMKCTPGARWFNDLRTNVYFNYELPGLKRLANNLDSLELDDNGVPFYTATVLGYKDGWRNPVPTGVIVVDPQTCAITEYALKDVPAWVDVIWPLDLAKDYFTYYATYSKWDECFGGVGCGKAGKQMIDSINDVIGPRDQQYQVVVSSVGADLSATELILFDPRAGTAVRYPYTGAIIEKVMSTVQLASPSLIPGSKGFLPQECEIHGIAGQYVAFCILSNMDQDPKEEHAAMAGRGRGGFAFLPLSFADKSDFVGLGGTVGEAYNDLLDILQKVQETDPNLSQNVETTQYSGKISRIGDIGDYTYFTIAGTDAVFRVSNSDPSLSVVASLTREGDDILVSAQKLAGTKYLLVKVLLNNNLPTDLKK